jgi:hypothetical protein
MPWKIGTHADTLAAPRAAPTARNIIATETRGFITFSSHVPALPSAGMARHSDTD